MRRTMVSLAAVAAFCALFALDSTRPAFAGKKKAKVVQHRCDYCAHGSEAERKRTDNVRPDNPGGGRGRGGGGGGGGDDGDGKKAPCSKTFASWDVTTIDVFIDSANTPPGISRATFEAYVRHALDEWSCHSGLGESTAINIVGSAAGAEITVSWGNLGSAGILGQASTSYIGSTIVDSDITMNNNGSVPWTAGPSPDIDADRCAIEANNAATLLFDLLSVLTHEVGHALGVAHPNNRCSTRDKCYPESMYSCTDSGEYMRRALNAGDRASISLLYGPDS